MKDVIWYDLFQYRAHNTIKNTQSYIDQTNIVMKTQGAKEEEDIKYQVS